jgi:hypothetical protein
MTIQIDPVTGERVSSAPSGGGIQIDPVTGERIAAAPAPQITDNPSGEGTYPMWNTAGQKLGVPYSKVGPAALQGYKFDTNPDQSGMTPQQRYLKDVAATQPPSMLQRAGTVAADVGKGLGESAVSLMMAGDRVARKIPGIGEWLTTPITGTPADKAYANNLALATPANTTQAVGKGVGEAAQFLIPGDAERMGVAKAIEWAPQLAKAAPALRIAAGALSSGGVNAAQGGSFGYGALYGGAGGALGEGLRVAAPKLAESALAVRNTDRAFGANPGQAILDETSGFKPAAIANQAQNRVADLNAFRQGLAINSPATVSLWDPLKHVTDAMQEQALRNSASGVERLTPLQHQLLVQTEPKGGFPIGVTPRYPPGKAIPMNVPVSEALDMREGIGNFQADKPWTGKASSDPLTGAVKGAYGSLANNIHAAVPDIAPLDARMHSLIPVANRASEMDLNASTLQRVAGRFAKPTGALFSAGAGAGYGYHEGGAPGAVLGGVAGLAAPEIIASPAVQMGLARGLYGGGTAASRFMTGAAANLYRKPEEEPARMVPGATYRGLYSSK